MKGKVEGERDQGNAHLVQDRGQIGSTQRRRKGKRDGAVWQCLRLESASVGAPGCERRTERWR